MENKLFQQSAKEIQDKLNKELFLVFNPDSQQFLCLNANGNTPDPNLADAFTREELTRLNLEGQKLIKLDSDRQIQINNQQYQNKMQG